MHQRDAICADYLPERRAHRVKEPGFFSGRIHCAGARVVVEFADQMRENFRVSFGAKVRIAISDQFIFERLIVFDHPVMDQREFAARVEMRVRILIVHLAVRGPARVADAEGTRNRLLRH